VNISPSADLVVHLKPWLFPYALLGAAAAALAIAGRRLRPRLVPRLIAALVVIDVVVFTVLAVVEVAPGVLSGGSAATVSPAGDGGAEAPAQVLPVAALGYPGRFAIYDPDLLDPGELSGLDPPDNNASGDGAMPSMQGYTSTVDGRYASVTGSHLATGDGQDTLAAEAVANGTLDQLDTSVLLTPAAYLVTPADGVGPAGGPPGTGRRDMSADQPATWYLGTTIDVAAVQVPDARAGPDAAAGTQIGLMAPDGSTRWFRARAMTASVLAITAAQPVASVAVLARTSGRPGKPGRSAGAGRPGKQSTPGPLGAPSIVAADGSVSVADGQLQDVLVPPHWEFAGFDGPFAVFANRSARPSLSIEALPGRFVSGAWLRGSGGAPAEPAAATVFSPHGARIVRSVAAIAGWSATWQPRHGPATALAVQPDGLVQAVDVPPGLGVVTWSYTPPGFLAGLTLSLAAAVLALSLFVLALLSRRARKRTTGVRALAADLEPRTGSSALLRDTAGS
jgi:hypothetical protein